MHTEQIRELKKKLVGVENKAWVLKNRLKATDTEFKKEKLTKKKNFKKHYCTLGPNCGKQNDNFFICRFIYFNLIKERIPESLLNIQNNQKM